ncbi:DUF1656 domain-containing protein [Gluconobacter sp. OJB]|uniref:DUF1656 domain-containing protein n=1 Tax=Gluconobacter sp. OJB TaxID=3145196 RepID=UPI0031F7D74F
MIPDLCISSVFVPGLLGGACIALVTTVVLLRLLTALGAWKLLSIRSFVELAVFVILFSLLAQGLSIIGPLP